MQPVNRTNLADSAAENLRAEIVSGRWGVGDRIPNETVLTELLSVSRGTVREAVRVLVSQGLLDTRQGSGPMCARRSIRPARSTASNAPDCATDGRRAPPLMSRRRGLLQSAIRQATLSA